MSALATYGGDNNLSVYPFLTAIILVIRIVSDVFPQWGIHHKQLYAHNYSCTIAIWLGSTTDED